tara:strand:- start:62 stop:553 length:492 start_codon:yes stop_codon:yes gene_type:complete
MIKPNDAYRTLKSVDNVNEDITEGLAGIANQLESLGATNPSANNVAPVGSSGIGGGSNGSLTDLNNAMIDPTEAQEGMMGNNFNPSASQAMQGIYGSALARNRAASAPARDLLPGDIERKENKFLKTMRQLDKPMSSKKADRKTRKAEKTARQIDNKKEGYNM